MFGQGVTPLMSAVKHKNVELVKMLIRAKSNMDLTSQTSVRVRIDPFIAPCVYVTSV